jgi:bifunctional non-homologous end joining protein LigD
MPPFVAPQLCTSVDRPLAGGDWVYEIKFDGYRIQMRVENGAVSLKTRKGLDWTAKFGSPISRAASKLPDCLIDGEVVALDHRGSPDFAGLQAALSESKTDDLIFFAFDLLFLEDEDLATRFSSPPAECPWKASYPKADAPYTSGRGDTWNKAKCRAGHEVVIGAWNSNGSRFRSLMAGVYRG